MDHPLRLHPDSRCEAVTRIGVQLARPRTGALALRYVMTGRVGNIRLAPVGLSRRADELWRHTCFEGFVRAAPREAYLELNFAPSTAWAAYRFERYREGMSVANEIGAPSVDVDSAPDCFTLQTTIDLSAVPQLELDAAWRVGLSAVIEETNGRISYWALRHPPGKPDFHHSDCFALEVAPAFRA